MAESSEVEIISLETNAGVGGEINRNVTPAQPAKIGVAHSARLFVSYEHDSASGACTIRIFLVFRLHRHLPGVQSQRQLADFRLDYPVPQSG